MRSGVGPREAGPQAVRSGVKSEDAGFTALGVTDTTIVPISEAHITTLPIGDGKTLWLRTWGRATGTPVLFVHGGPGQCVADYNDINAKFFEASEFHVVEVDLSNPQVVPGRSVEK